MEKEQHNGQSIDKYFFRASAEDFKRITGVPIAYWVSDKIIKAFEREIPLYKRFPVKSGIMTGNDPLFLRLWYEVNNCKISFRLTSPNQMKGYWYPISKGGDYRKWYGNSEHIINLFNDASDIKNGGGNFRLREEKWYFRPYVTWSRITSSSIAFRILYEGILFADAAPGIFANSNCNNIIALLNSKLGNYFLAAINPTLNFQTNDIERIPSVLLKDVFLIKDLINKARTDWDSYETSWDFTSLPLLQTNYHRPTIKSTYHNLCSFWQEQILEMQQLEVENNRIFIEAYGLEEELTPDVPLEEITLTCNPHYRYGKNKSATDLEKLLLADTMKEYISYAVGCMFGRYSLDKEGLILANQGDTLQEYLSQIPEPAFMPDEDNVIPILDDNWFVDDIVDRFYAFLRVTFWTERFNENIQFIEDAIGKNLRNFFVTDFYTDHVKRYKKRPIYWMFSSPKGSFNVLIYMHRYNEGTVSTILNKYLREFQNKLKAHEIQLQEISESSTARPGDKTKALKKIQKVRKSLDEIVQWERTVIYPLATQRIVIDLDDGVKVNYQKFDSAVKKIPGLN